MTWRHFLYSCLACIPLSFVIATITRGHGPWLTYLLTMGAIAIFVPTAFYLANRKEINEAWRTRHSRKET